MALYVPDYKLRDAKKAVSDLPNGELKQHIEYMLEDKDNSYKELKDRFNELVDALRALKKYS